VCLPDRVRRISIDTFSSIVVMSTSPTHAPWQLSAGSAPSRIIAAALVAVALDSTFAWGALPLVASLALLIVPLLVAIRVVRGFPRSLMGAALMLGAAEILAVAGRTLITPTALRPAHLTAAITVAGIVSVVGLAAVAMAWWSDRRSRRPAIITIELTESGGFAVVRKGRSR
jgi:hypothetical protein